VAKLTVGGTAIISGHAPEETWRFMVDPTTLHMWVAVVNKPGKWLGDGNAETVGSEYIIDYEYGRKTNEIMFALIASEPGKTIAVDTVRGPFPVKFLYELSNPGEGQSTSVDWTMEARSDSFLTALGFYLTCWIVKPMMRKRTNEEFIELQSALDAR
jgi:hypothetical protein